LLWPRASATSALIEVGYALARQLPVICLHQRQAAPPFLLSQDSTCVRRIAYDTHDEFRHLIETTSLRDCLPS
jgi:nucleoside 2-deoxyribosyltransferase